VLNPALILRGQPVEILVVVATAVIGIWLIASALEGYLAGFGALGGGASGAVARLLLLAGGLFMALPGGGELGLSHVQLSAAGLGLAVAAVAWAAAARRLLASG